MPCLSQCHSCFLRDVCSAGMFHLHLQPSWPGRLHLHARVLFSYLLFTLPLSCQCVAGVSAAHGLCQRGIDGQHGRGGERMALQECYLINSSLSHACQHHNPPSLYGKTRRGPTVQARGVKVWKLQKSLLLSVFLLLTHDQSQNRRKQSAKQGAPV